MVRPLGRQERPSRHYLFRKPIRRQKTHTEKKEEKKRRQLTKTVTMVTTDRTWSREKGRQAGAGWRRADLGLIGEGGVGAGVSSVRDLSGAPGLELWWC